MEMWTSLLIVLAVFALGDVISILTKARISSLFVIMMTFLILFLSHTIPPDIVKRAGLETLGPIAIGMLLVNMGSSVDVRMLKREWRSVVGSIISMIIAVVSCLAMIPLIGRENALASAPVINGGVIATNTMVAAALEKGLPLTAALAAFLYATQKFVGTLPASYFGLRALGLVPPNFMKNHGVSTGFFMFGVLTVIVPSLAKVDLSMLPQLGFFVACVFALTLLGIVVVFKVLPVWKIVGDRDLAIGIAMCQMIGYPGTQLISDEIAKTVGETDEEVDYLSTRIGTAYVISGFTSVTIFSIIVASIMAHLL